MAIYTLYQYQHHESGKRYIGVTNDVARRCQEHTRGKSGAGLFSRAVKKYGIDAFDFKILALFDRTDAACYHEQAVILKFNTITPGGYNLRAGAPCTRYAGPHSAEDRKRRSIQRLGYRHSLETRKKISVGNSGKTRTVEMRRQSSVAHQNPSAETRKKMSLSHIGHHHSEETKAKMSASHKRRIA
jgi:group I intron endonuclease